MANDTELGTIETDVPARLDRLPWSRFHWRVLIGLGTVWILDGLEVTIVGSIAARLTESGSGAHLSSADIGTGAAAYVAGACLGALFFGQLTDRFGRKRLFILTLGVYVAATVATAFTFAPWYFLLTRFFTGAGIGGEYAAINSAIDELIPARVRGRVDLIINGSYWVGAAIGAVAALVFLNTSIFAVDVGWRIAFAVGAVLGVSIFIVRRHVPESPRWLFIHGREDEAERIVDQIESGIREETHQDLPAPERTIRIRQRRSLPFRAIFDVAVKAYPERAILCFALFVGQAFLYNAVTFDLGTILSKYFAVASGAVPYYMVAFAVGNFLGPVLLGRLFDTVGRKPMIAGTYLGSAAVVLVLGILLASKSLSSTSFIILVCLAFFLASAGASSAYLTVSEIFPMETRALAIAFFYALGTGAGGIVGPLLFGHLIDSGNVSTLAIGFFIGAGIMALGGLAEIVVGVRSERRSLEDIARPLTAEDTVGDAGAPRREAGRRPDHEQRQERRDSLNHHARAEQERARAAEHRATIHELRARGDGDPSVARRAQIEEELAEIAELRAQSLDEQARSHEEREAAAAAADRPSREAALRRSEAAAERARALHERAEAVAADHHAEEQQHQALAEAAGERARAREHRAQAEEARGAAQGAEGGEADVAQARAELHEGWAEMHAARAAAHEARAEADLAGAAERDRAASRLEELALAAEQRVDAARHRAAADEARGEREHVEEERRKRDAAERERLAREREERLRARLDRRLQRERSGLRRFRPGPGSAMYSPWMAIPSESDSDGDIDREIDVIARALDEHGPTNRQDLARRVGARYWGPGRFGRALREAVEEGRARRLSRTTYAPPERSGQDLQREGRDRPGATAGRR